MNYKPSPEAVNENLIRITLNGIVESVQKGTTLRAVLEKKEINPSVVACELNMKIVRRAEIGSTLLKEGDVLEIIRMMGGG